MRKEVKNFKAAETVYQSKIEKLFFFRLLMKFCCTSLEGFLIAYTCLLELRHTNNANAENLHEGYTCSSIIYSVRLCYNY